ERLRSPGRLAKPRAISVHSRNHRGAFSIVPQEVRAGSGARLTRRWLLASTAATIPLAAQAQQRRIYRIGYIGNSSAELDAPLWAGFRQGMSEQGYVEGRDVIFEVRWAGGEASRLPALAAELIALPVDVIVVSGTPATQAAIAASRTVPIVMAAIG